MELGTSLLSVTGVAFVDDALEIQRRLRDPFGTAHYLMNVGIIEENQGRLALARRHYTEALERAERVHYRQVQCAAHANLGNLAHVRERFIEAQEHNARSLEIARAIQDARSEAIAREDDNPDFYQRRG